MKEILLIYFIIFNIMFNLGASPQDEREYNKPIEDNLFKNILKLEKPSIVKYFADSDKLIFSEIKIIRRVNRRDYLVIYDMTKKTKDIIFNPIDFNPITEEDSIYITNYYAINDNEIIVNVKVFYSKNGRVINSIKKVYKIDYMNLLVEEYDDSFFINGKNIFQSTRDRKFFINYEYIDNVINLQLYDYPNDIKYHSIKMNKDIDYIILLIPGRNKNEIILYYSYDNKFEISFYDIKNNDFIFTKIFSDIKEKYNIEGFNFVLLSPDNEYLLLVNRFVGIFLYEIKTDNLMELYIDKKNYYALADWSWDSSKFIITSPYNVYIINIKDYLNYLLSGQTQTK